MGAIQSFDPEKLVIPMLLSGSAALDEILGRIATEFGRTDFVSSPIQFRYTDYYLKEMGPDLSRVIVSIERPVAPESLAEAKVRSNALEDHYSVDGRRTVNFDPGLVSLKHLILASTKDNGRRVPLSRGIYAEITLVYYNGDFQPVEWTYPDYATREYRDVFCEIRSTLRLQLKQQSRTAR